MLHPLLACLALTLLTLACEDESADADTRPPPPPSEDGGPPDLAVIDASPPPLDGSAPFLEIGTGARRYEPLEAGQRIPIIQGIQGGYHVWGGLRAAGFEDAEVRIRFALHRGDELLAQADYIEPTLPVAADGTYTYGGVAVVFVDNALVDPASGQTLRLSAEVEATDGTRLGDAVEVVPVCCEQ